MEEPTEAQVKEFFKEWCGFKRLPKGNKGFHFELGVKVMNWQPPDTKNEVYGIDYLPRISLDNLFKYAIPKLKRWEMGSQLNGMAYARVSTGTMLPKESENKDPALALFWAIWQII